MSYDDLTKAEALEILNTLDKATARFMSDADDGRDGPDKWLVALRGIWESCDRLSHEIEGIREHFADDYRLIEVTVSTTHHVWVKGGDTEHALQAASDFLMMNLCTSVCGDPHLAAWVEDVNQIEKRSGTDWETGQTADIEI